MAVTTAYPPVTPTLSMSAPAVAGPIIMLALMPMESRATPFVTRLLPRRSCIRERLEGMSNAHETPMTSIAG